MTAKDIPGWPEKYKISSHREHQVDPEDHWCTNCKIILTPLEIDCWRIFDDADHNKIVIQCEFALAPYEIIPKEKLTMDSLQSFAKEYDIYFMGDKHKKYFLQALRSHLGLANKPKDA